ncbi:hypothetical protein [Pandoraea sp. ISTKB]|uniref:hypothetical protein n=1 Tax=Pandoraea sp. ISTKB TaxID=1586708 RepID=UPI001112D65A|nr:hypothetical protein [Pandoraea sp. ISTKB]
MRRSELKGQQMTELVIELGNAVSKSANHGESPFDSDANGEASGQAKRGSTSKAMLIAMCAIDARWSIMIVSPCVCAMSGSVAEDVTDVDGALHAGLDAGVVVEEAVDEVEEEAHGRVLRYGWKGEALQSAEDRGDGADQAEDRGEAVGDECGHGVSP